MKKMCIDCGKIMSKKSVSRCFTCFEDAIKQWGRKNYIQIMFIPRRIWERKSPTKFMEQNKFIGVVI